MTPDYRSRTIAADAWWSPLSDQHPETPVEDLLKHPRVLLDPTQVLPQPHPLLPTTDS